MSGPDVVGRVNLAREGDIPAWLALASEVEELFGEAMSTDLAFAATVLKNVRRGSALVVREPDKHAAELIGAALWSPVSREIGWLVVAAAWRGRGVGTMLVDAIVAAAGAGPLRVVTFAPGSLERERARRFYTNQGFQEIVSSTTLEHVDRHVLVRG